MRGLRGLRLSRGQRTLVNLCLCALLLTGLWGLFGYPLPTAELELRRWERTGLLEPGEVVFSKREGGTLEGLAGGYSVQFSQSVIVSVTEDRAVIGGKFRRWSFYALPLGEAPLVAWIPGMMSLPVFSEAGPSLRIPVLAFRLPEEAASGEITLMGRRGTAEVPLTGPGWEIGEGVWLFAANTLQDSYALSGDAPCTLRLYRADGSPLPEWNGTLYLS